MKANNASFAFDRMTYMTNYLILKIYICDNRL